MARFVFELEPVLEMRRRAERERQRTVAELERERLELEGEIRSCQGLIDDEKRAMRAGLGGEGTGLIDLRGVRLQANASLHLVARAQRAALRLAGTYKRLEQARSALIEATASRRAVEQLREARYEAWLTEQRRREAAALDEMAVMRHAARGAEDGGMGGAMTGGVGGAIGGEAA